MYPLLTKEDKNTIDEFFFFFFFFFFLKKTKFFLFFNNLIKNSCHLFVPMGKLQITS